MKIHKLLLLLLVVLVYGCQKNYLSKKPDNSLLIPVTLSDFQNLLDNLNVFNIQPGLQIIASDDYQTTDVKLGTFSQPEINSYLWLPDIDQGQPMQDWSIPYQQVFYANIVLDGLEKAPATDASRTQWNVIKGTALFHRAFAFYNLSQLYAKPYKAESAETDLGIPIRLEADVNLKSTRGTLQQTYTQIIADLQQALPLLPVTSAYQSRPNQAAGEAMLAKVYLVMGDYPGALQHATASLKLNSVLLDYNSISTTLASPFPAVPTVNNAEVLFYSRPNSYTYSISSSTTVNSDLYSSYDVNDLRKTIFFTTGTAPYFKGRYTGSTLRLFGGLTTAEMYLVKAECEARTGQVNAAIDDLNLVLKKRWKNTVTYPVRTAGNPDDALMLILAERRKELVFRGLRWSDLRRMNTDLRFAITMSRTFNNQTYTLKPQSNLYTFPIPAQEILTSGIEQNPR